MRESISDHYIATLNSFQNTIYTFDLDIASMPLCLVPALIYSLELDTHIMNKVNANT